MKAKSILSDGDDNTTYLYLSPVFINEFIKSRIEGLICYGFA